MKFLTDANHPVAHVVSVKEEVVAAPEVVAAEAVAPAEPEVIKKGKQESRGRGRRRGSRGEAGEGRKEGEEVASWRRTAELRSADSPIGFAQGKRGRLSPQVGMVA